MKFKLSTILGWILSLTIAFTALAYTAYKFESEIKPTTNQQAYHHKSFLNFILDLVQTDFSLLLQNPQNIFSPAG